MFVDLQNVASPAKYEKNTRPFNYTYIFATAEKKKTASRVRVRAKK